MKPISPFITIKPKKMELISNFLCDQEEVLYASKTQFNFPPIRNLPAQKGYLILTYGFIYLFTKENKEPKLQEQICVFNCQEIKFINEKGKNIKSAILIKTDSEQNLFTIFNGKKMESFYESLIFSIFIITSGSSAHFTLPNLIPTIPLKSFPVQFCILKRSLYYIHSDMKKQNIPKTAIEAATYFDNPSIYFRGQLLIDSNFHPNNFSNYYGKAIGIEPQLYVVVFSNFNDDFNNFLESILENSKRINQIKFSEYISSAPVFNIEKVTKTNIATFQFVNSNFFLVENFLNGCLNCQCHIKNIKLNSIQMQESDLINTLDNLNKTKCFDNLTSFKLVNMKFGQFPFEVFNQFLQLHKSLKLLTISNIDIDGTAILSEICKAQPNIYELHLNQLNFESPLNFSEDQNFVSLPQNIVLLDFSHSRFKNLSLKPIFEFVTSPNINASKLMLNMSNLEPKDNTFVNTFKSLDMQKCQSNIVDFNWSGNHISADLFSFISSQKQIQYLSLNELNIERQGNFFSHLLKALSGLNIVGFEIGCSTFTPEFINPFLMALKEFESLQHFGFRCQPEQNEIAEKVAELISSLSNLKEVIVDMQKLSPDAYFKVASAVAYNKSIAACSFMNCEVDKKDPKLMEISIVLKTIQSMKIPSTMEQRALSSVLHKRKANLNPTNANVNNADVNGI